MKKIGIFFAILLLTISFSDVRAQLRLEIPRYVPQESSLFTSTYSSDNLSLNDTDLKSNLKLNIPESIVKLQSDYAVKAKMLLMLHLILSLPTGSFGDTYNTGIGVNATFAYMLYSYLMLTGSLGYISWGGDSEVEDFTGDVSLSSIPFLLGIRYLFAAGSAFAPYILGELGLHFFSTSFEYEIAGVTYEDSQTSTEFCLGLGGGFMYALSAMLLLDVNLRYWIISDFGNLAFMAGLAYSLGGM